MLQLGGWQCHYLHIFYETGVENCLLFLQQKIGQTWSFNANLHRMETQLRVDCASCSCLFPSSLRGCEWGAVIAWSTPVNTAMERCWIQKYKANCRRKKQRFKKKTKHKTKTTDPHSCNMHEVVCSPGRILTSKAPRSTRAFLGKTLSCILLENATETEKQH